MAYILKRNGKTPNIPFKHFECDAVADLSRRLGIPQTLRESEIAEEMISQLANQAIDDACTPGNPREVSREDFIELFRRAF